MSSDHVLPDTYIVGAPKCGTTALAAYLSEHPDVFLGYPKEPSYWSSDFRHSNSVASMADVESYASIYEAATQKRVLDASTRYLYSDVAIPRILKAVSDPRFIVMLRDPVELAQAYHMEKVFNHFEDVVDFEAAWRLQESRSSGANLPAACDEPKELQYGKVASIGSQLLRASAWISPDRLLVMFLDDLVRSPDKAWSRVLKFLDIPGDGRTEFPRHGAAHFHRFHRIARVYQNPPTQIAPLTRALKRSLRRSDGAMSRGLTRLLVRRGERDAISPAFRRELYEYFADEIALVESLTSRDLTTWKISQ